MVERPPGSEPAMSAYSQYIRRLPKGFGQLNTCKRPLSQQDKRAEGARLDDYRTFMNNSIKALRVLVYVTNKSVCD